jgi:hypothetical protein|nr:hypothetical protein [Kofleriaceae bacterium]
MYARTKGGLISSIRSVVAGLASRFAGQTLTVNSTAYKAEDLVALLDGFVAQLQEVDAAYATWKQKLDAWKTVEATKVTPLMSALARTLQGAFGATNPALGEFGLAPLRRTAPSAETVASAVEKRRATRIARHTLGRRQRAAIHGAPVTAPTAPTAPTDASPSVAPMRKAS